MANDDDDDGENFLCDCQSDILQKHAFDPINLSPSDMIHPFVSVSSATAVQN